MTHELVKNNGEVESFYVKKHHEPIINPNEWETVQAELKKRKTVGSTNNYINAFLGRVVCADCGTSYGPKIWHSTSKYRREVYQCNAKFKNKCKTPTLTEDEMKGLFLKAYSQFMGNKAQVIEDTEEMIQTLCDTTKLQKDIETLTTKAEDIVVLAENLITRNATQAMNPDEFESRYESYDNEHNQLIEKITKKQNQIKERKSKAICLKAFIKELRERETILNEFDEMVWSYLIEKATVNRDGSVSFLFRNGVEVRV